MDAWGSGALPAPLPQVRDIEAEGSDTRTGLIINLKLSKW